MALIVVGKVGGHYIQVYVEKGATDLASIPQEALKAASLAIIGKYIYRGQSRSVTSDDLRKAKMQCQGSYVVIV